MDTQYSNPRLEATFDNWPLGGTRRGQCRFFVEKNARGARVGRITTGKPKYTTYRSNEDVCIVDGDDGRTYILQDVKIYNFISVTRSDFMTHDSIHKSSEPEKYEEVLNLIRQANR